MGLQGAGPPGGSDTVFLGSVAHATARWMGLLADPAGPATIASEASELGGLARARGMAQVGDQLTHIRELAGSRSAELLQALAQLRGWLASGAGGAPATALSARMGLQGAGPPGGSDTVFLGGVTHATARWMGLLADPAGPATIASEASELGGIARMRGMAQVGNLLTRIQKLAGSRSAELPQALAQLTGWLASEAGGAPATAPLERTFVMKPQGPAATPLQSLRPVELREAPAAQLPPAAHPASIPLPPMLDQTLSRQLGGAGVPPPPALESGRRQGGHLVESPAREAPLSAPGPGGAARTAATRRKGHAGASRVQEGRTGRGPRRRGGATAAGAGRPWSRVPPARADAVGITSAHEPSRARHEAPRGGSPAVGKPRPRAQPACALHACLGVRRRRSARRARARWCRRGPAGRP